LAPFSGHLGAIGVDTGHEEQLITVAETPVFVRQAKDVWDETEHDEFVLYIAGNPEAGAVIADTGGVRKVRWSRAGSGKRGGVRVIYFITIFRRDREARSCLARGSTCAPSPCRDANRPLYLPMVYAKGRQDDLEPDEKRVVREFANVIKAKKRARE
jgi:hypothetical protein